MNNVLKPSSPLSELESHADSIDNQSAERSDLSQGGFTENLKNHPELRKIALGLILLLSAIGFSKDGVINDARADGGTIDMSEVIREARFQSERSAQRIKELKRKIEERRMHISEGSNERTIHLQNEYDQLVEKQRNQQARLTAIRLRQENLIAQRNEICTKYRPMMEDIIKKSVTKELDPLEEKAIKRYNEECPTIELTDARR